MRSTPPVSDNTSGYTTMNTLSSSMLSCLSLEHVILLKQFSLKDFSKCATRDMPRLFPRQQIPMFAEASEIQLNSSGILITGVNRCMSHNGPTTYFLYSTHIERACVMEIYRYRYCIFIYTICFIFYFHIYPLFSTLHNIHLFLFYMYTLL